jgi:CRISPR-associated endonuclease/helicase Cas3
VRHNFVRAFGLHRSVLIVDEVHAYDAYMNGLLGEVLKRQKATGGSVILLSATLPAGIRQRLLAAWDTEAQVEQAPYPAIWNTPVLSVTDLPLTVPEAEIPSERSIDVTLSKLSCALPDPVLIRRIIAAAESGALVGIVMNTVDSAQQLSRLLRGETDAPVDLFHARFRLKDRQCIEQGVIERYGRHAARDQGRILVATQVIEQSLDLDFDWLITQICPVDLLFQRLGRLHRHPRTRPAGFEHPVCTVLSVEADDFDVHELIYGDVRLLWRTEQLLARSRYILFPDAYRGWIEPVYEESVWDDEPDDICGKHIAWRDDQESAQNEAIRLTSMTVKQFRDDDKHMSSLTRDGEMSLSVLILRQDSCLLEGEALDGIDEHANAEAIMLNTAPAPRSWEKRFSGHERDDDGRIQLRMKSDENVCWISSDGAFVYSSELGLAKSEQAGREDPPAQTPRKRGERARLR